MHVENPSSRVKQSCPALLTCSDVAVEKACFLGNQTGPLCQRNGEGGEREGGGGVEWRYDTHTDLHLTSRWTCPCCCPAFLERKNAIGHFGLTNDKWNYRTIKCLVFSLTSKYLRIFVIDAVFQFQNSMQLQQKDEQTVATSEREDIYIGFHHSSLTDSGALTLSWMPTSFLLLPQVEDSSITESKQGETEGKKNQEMK